MKSTLLYALAMLFIALPAHAIENLVNGGFESEPNFGAGSVGNDSGFSAFTGSQIPGWTIEAGHALTIHNTNIYPFITPTYSGNLDGEGFNGTNADFYQDFASVLGRSYSLTYDYQGWLTSTTVFTVTVSDLSSSSVLYSKVSPWTAALVNEGGVFLGTGNQLRLRVVETPTGVNDNAFIVDNFSVESVPEPAALAMISVVAAAVLRVRRKGR